MRVSMWTLWCICIQVFTRPHPYSVRDGFGKSFGCLVKVPIYFNDKIVTWMHEQQNTFGAERELFEALFNEEKLLLTPGNDCHFKNPGNFRMVGSVFETIIFVCVHRPTWFEFKQNHAWCMFLRICMMSVLLLDGWIYLFKYSETCILGFGISTQAMSSSNVLEPLTSQDWFRPTKSVYVFVAGKCVSCMCVLLP